MEPVETSVSGAEAEIIENKVLETPSSDISNSETSTVMNTDSQVEIKSEVSNQVDPEAEATINPQLEELKTDSNINPQVPNLTNPIEQTKTDNDVQGTLTLNNDQNESEKNVVLETKNVEMNSNPVVSDCVPITDTNLAPVEIETAITLDNPTITDDSKEPNVNHEEASLNDTEISEKETNESSIKISVETEESKSAVNMEKSDEPSTEEINVTPAKELSATAIEEVKNKTNSNIEEAKEVKETTPIVAITETSAVAESLGIDEKSEGIFLETTNETINAESTQEEEDKDISGLVSEKENPTEEVDPTEASNDAENLANMEENSSAPTAVADTSTIKTEEISANLQSTPKQAPRKKAKSSTPSKHSLNDSHTGQKRRKKDPSAPKAPLNGYLVYFNDERADMRMKNPSMSFGELTKIIALKWKDLPAEEKQKFITEADLDKERYVKEMAEYKKSDSYKNYVKETSQAKMARNDEILNNSLQNDGLNPMNAPNSFTIANETNIAGFDIPIFTEEFIEHSKSRENEMRLVRKEIIELEQQNSVLHKHIEIMKQSSVKLDADIDRFQNTNNQLKKKMDAFRQTIINCNIQLPNTMEYPTPNNIDDYIMKLYGLVANNNPANGNQNDAAFVSHVKSVLSKINFNNLFVE